MPFQDYHLFEFRADGKRDAIPDPEWDSFGEKTQQFSCSLPSMR